MLPRGPGNLNSYGDLTVRSGAWCADDADQAVANVAKVCDSGTVAQRISVTHTAINHVIPTQSQTVPIGADHRKAVEWFEHRQGLALIENLAAAVAHGSVVRAQRLQ